MSVYLGKSKLYTMPFWRCNQYDNMLFLKEKSFDNIPIQEYLKNRRLERFLKEKCNASSDKFDIKELSGKEEYLYYLNQIQRHKIYDINWSMILPVKSTLIKKLMTNESTIVKTYEKKFLKKEKIYVDEIKIADYEHFFEIEQEKELEKNEQSLNEEEEEKDDDDLLFEAGNDEEDLNDLFDTYQSKKLQTADDKVVKKEKEKTEETVPTITLSTAEILKREAYSRTTENDFLLDMGEYEIPNIETTIDILEEKPTYTTAHYFGKELLNIINLETTMKDIFVLPPEKRNAKKLREGAGYLLTKLKTIESYYVTQQCFKYNIPMNVNYYTIGNFLTNLNLLLGMIDYCEEKMDFSSLKWLVIILYKLLCKSFLSQNNHDLDEKSFFCFKRGNNIIPEKREKEF